MNVVTDDMVRRVVQATGSATGGEFFSVFVQSVAELFQVRRVIAGSLTNSARKRVRSLAVWGDGRLQPPLEYELEGTPCEQVIVSGACAYSKGVRSLFPRDARLRAMGAESYVGVSVRARGGRVVGLLAGLHDGPMDGQTPALSRLLELFGPRAAAEMDRRDGEEAFQDRERQHRELMAHLPVVVYRLPWPQAHGPRFFSDAVFSLLGVAAPELMSSGAAEWPRWLQGEDQPRYLQVIEQAARGGGSYEIEYRVRHRGGELRWLQDRGQVHRNSAGSGFWLEGTLVDVTERRGALERIQLSEERFRSVCDASPLGMHFYSLSSDDAMVLVGTNAAASRILGIDHGPLLGLDILEAFPALAGTVVPGIYRRIAQGKQEHWQTENISYKDGRIAGVYEVQAFRTGPGAMVALFQDITQRKLVELELRRLATAVEQADEDILITNVDGLIEYVNPAFERVTGYSRSESIGRNPRFLKSGRSSIEDYRDLWAAISHGKVWRGHFVNRRKDGSLVEEDATISPIHDESGRIVAYVSVKRDVTERVRLEGQLRQAQKMEAVGQLAGGIAHDFNNLLQGIFGYTELAREMLGASSPATENLDEIQRAATRAAELVKQLLLFSRRRQAELRSVDLNTMVTESARMLRRVIGEEIEMELFLAPGSLQVSGDATQFEQILMNLCVNARDAMAGGGRLSILTERVALAAGHRSMPQGLKGGGYAMLRVKDTGPGIPEAIRERIFDPFFTTKEVGKGTGLGLAIVYGIVRQYQGFLEVLSEPGQGADFRVYLPLLEGNAASERPKTESVHQGLGDWHARQARVLVAEDEDQLRRLVRRMLETVGCQVVLAADGQEALDHWEKAAGAFDLVVLDVVMPKRHGRQVYECIRRTRPEVPVLFITGYDREKVGTDFSTDSQVGVVYKPFETEQFLTLIRKLLPSDRES